MTTPKKAAKPVKRATKAAAKPSGARTSTAAKEAKAKAEQPTESGMPAPKTITFMDRELLVSLPDLEQIIAWEEVFGKLQSMDLETATGETVGKALRRTWIAINAILVNEEDVDWLRDMRMAKKVNIETGYKIMTDAMEAYGITEPTNRAARRAKK